MTSSTTGQVLGAATIAGISFLPATTSSPVLFVLASLVRVTAVAVVASALITKTIIFLARK